MTGESPPAAPRVRGGGAPGRSGPCWLVLPGRAGRVEDFLGDGHTDRWLGGTHQSSEACPWACSRPHWGRETTDSSDPMTPTLSQRNHFTLLKRDSVS